jgi:hypothetical protein
LVVLFRWLARRVSVMVVVGLLRWLQVQVLVVAAVVEL